MKILFLFLILWTPTFAYLDPGSGSLLLSSIVAIFASAMFFIKNIFYKIIASPLGIKSINVYGGGGGKSIAFYCEGIQYYDTFKPILDTLDAFSHPYVYYTSSPKDPALQRDTSKYGEFIYIGEKNKAYNFINKLKADIFVMTTPGLDVLQIKRNKGVAHYCHIVHSLTPMTYRVFGVDYFDSVLVANTTQRDFIRDIESAHKIKAKHIAITGSTYLDELHKLRLDLICDKSKYKQNNTQDSTPTILISPSWGKESLLNKYGLALLLPLAQSGFHIIIRPHPQSFIAPNEKANIQELQDVLSTFSNVSWDSNTPNIYVFLKADMMISDFSSVIFDFICLEKKPVLTIDNEMDLSGYDMADIPREDIWTFKALERIGGRIKSTDFPHIKELCKKALKQTSQLDEIKTLLWQYPLSAGEVSALEILKIEREIIESKLKPYMSSIARLRELDKMIERAKKDAI